MTGKEARGGQLSELADVTRHYAAYSRTAYGLAGVVAGAITVGVLAGDLGWKVAWTRTAYYLITPIWLLLVRYARRYYQRHGAVIERDRELVHLRGKEIAIAYLLSVAHAFLLSRGGLELVCAGWLKLIALSGVVAVPLLAAEWMRSGSDFSITSSLLLGVMLVGTNSAEGGVGEGGAVGVLMLALSAIVLLVSGTREHVRYRRLERRLAVLKGSAP